MSFKISAYCRLIIKICFLGLFFFVPLVFTSFNSELFEFTKMIFVYVMTIIIFGCWIARMIVEKKLIFKRTFWDFPLILFFVAISLSTIFSHDIYMSLFGYYSRFHQGLFSLVAFLVLYWAFVSNIGEDSYGFRADSTRMKKTDNYNIRGYPPEIRENPSAFINKLILTIILSSLAVAIYGICQHFGLDFFRWVQDVQFRVFSSMGQPNWLGAYLDIAMLFIFPFLLLHNIQDSSLNFRLNPKSEIRNPKQIQMSKNQIQNKNLSTILSNGTMKQWNNRLFFIFYFLTFNLLYACLLFTRSRSAFTAFHVCFFILTIFLFRKFKKIFIAAYLMFFILINVFNILPTPVEKINRLTIPDIVNKFRVETLHATSLQKQKNQPDTSTPSDPGGTESFAIRKIVWKGAWNAFVKNPVFGYGTETFALAYYRYKPIEQNLVSEWDFLYNKAHNEYLNYLATTGVVGFLAYLILIGSFIVYFIRMFVGDDLRVVPMGRTGMSAPTKLYNLSLFLAWLTILITNALGFSVVAISLFFYLIPAIMVVVNEKQLSVLSCQLSDSSLSVVSHSVLKTDKPETDKPISENRKLRTDNRTKILQFVVLSFLLLTTYYVLRTTVSWWLADIHFARGQAASSQNEYNSAFQEYTAAIDLSPYHPAYHNEFGVTLSEMASYFNIKKEKSLAKNLAEKAIEESTLAVSISPNNPIFRNYQALVFHNLEFADKKYSRRAVDSILASYTLSPNDPKTTYHMAIYLLEDEQINKVMKAFEITEKLKPNYIEAMSNYAKLLADSGKEERARQILENLLKYYPGNFDIIKLIKSYED